MSSCSSVPTEVLTPNWGEARHGAHTAHFYEQDSFLLDALAPAVSRALRAGDSVVILATEDHRDGLESRLRASEIDVAKVSAQGRYISLDAAETLEKFMVGAHPDPVRFSEMTKNLFESATPSAQGTTPHIFAFGEMVAVLWASGNSEGALRLEQLWNEALRIYPLTLRCAYPMTGFNRGDDGHLFRKICSEHSDVIPVESYTALSSEELRLRSISQLQQKALALEQEMAERKQVEEALRQTKSDLESLVEQRTAALRQLSSRLLSLQDFERRRIARELHDSLGQYLVGLKLNVDMLRKSPGREELWTATDQLMQQCISQVRTLSYLLHPPTMDAAGFASAAHWYIEGFCQRSTLKVSLDAPDNLGRLADEIELALFRVLQEALTNVHLHSGASAASVLIRRDSDEIVLVIHDNGKGIPKELLGRFQQTGAGMGVGLTGIRERARELGGKLTVKSDSGGTLVRVTIPCRRKV